MFLFVEYLQQIKGSKCPSLTCLVYNPVAGGGGGGHEGFPMSTVTKINEAKVLFVKQARAAMSGGLVNELLNDIKALLSSHEEDSQVIPESSTFESGWDAVNYHVKSIKGGDIMILKMRLAKADNKFPETQEMLQKLGAFTTNRSGMLPRN